MAVERSSAMTEVGTQVQQAVDEELAAMAAAAEREPGGGGEHQRRAAASGRSSSSRAPLRVNWVKELPSLEHSPKLKRK